MGCCDDRQEGNSVGGTDGKWDGDDEANVGPLEGLVEGSWLPVGPAEGATLGTLLGTLVGP